MHADDYNPAQQEVVSLLGAPKGARPEFEPGLRDELRAGLEDRLEPLVERIGSDAFDDDVLYLSKFMLAQVLGCERKFMAERAEPFEWSPPTARGTIMHKAIELSVHWRGEPAPLALVDEALASLQNADKSIGDYLRTCREAERTELRAEAGSTMTQFLECFPPLKPAWRPTTESPIRASLHGGLIVLSGKPDLTLGQPEGTVAGKVIIDFKTGGFSPTHREDLRFYALLEALRILPAPPAGHLLPRPGPRPFRGGHPRPAAVGRRAGDRRRPSLRRADLGPAPGDRGSRPSLQVVARSSPTARREPSTWKAPSRPTPKIGDPHPHARAGAGRPDCSPTSRRQQRQRRVDIRHRRCFTCGPGLFM